MDYPDYLITGTGRSGTRYAATLMTELGYPCSHETWYNIYAECSGPPGGESSWLAVPRLPIPRPTVQLVRHPHKVLESRVSSMFLSFNREGPKTRWETYATVNMGWDAVEPSVEIEVLTERNVEFILRWSEMIEATEPPRFRVEDLRNEEILREFVYHLTGDWLDDFSKARTIPTDLNNRHPTIDLPPQPGLEALASRWGY